MNLETNYDSTAYNRAYLASLRFAQSLLCRTSDMLETLGEKAFHTIVKDMNEYRLKFRMVWAS